VFVVLGGLAAFGVVCLHAPSIHELASAPTDKSLKQPDPVDDSGSPVPTAVTPLPQVESKLAPPEPPGKRVLTDSFEPNGTIEEAKALELGKWTSVAMDPQEDVDVFRLTVPARGYLVRPATYKVPKGVTPTFQLRDEAGHPIKVTWPLRVAAGVYMLRMSAAGASATTFGLSVSWLVEMDACEPNSRAEPRSIPFGERHAVALYPRGDANWFGFEVSKTGYATARVEDYPLDRGYLKFECFGPKGKVSRGKNTAWRLDPGTYVLRMGTFQNVGGSTKTFPFRVDFREEYDFAEPNSSAKTAKPLAFGEKQTVALYPPGDRDWFRFEISKAGTVTARLEDYPLTRGYLRLGCFGPKGKTQEGKKGVWQLEPGAYTLLMATFQDRGGSEKTFSFWIEFKPKP
jgi:hypothetical protein